MSTDNKFDISVVIPIYNTEQYLSETIESVINQTLDFQNHIQLVLINDGSTDNSEEICLQYLRKYPDNIIYKYKDNGGVSSACNMGKKYAEGLLINFMGSDDKWSNDTFESVIKLAKSDEGEKTDLISTKIICFDASDAENVRNFQYERTGVIDLTKKDYYNYAQVTLGNCFLRNDAIKNIWFDEDVNYMEDTLFINTLLMEKSTVGVISDGICYYRKREQQSNLGAIAIENKERYLVTPKECFLKLFKLSKAKFGKVVPFIQYAVMFEMQWRFSEKLPLSMNEDDIEEYTSLLKQILQDVDDETIYRQSHLRVRDRVFVFKLKYGQDFFEKVEWKKSRAFYNGVKVYTLLGTNRVYWMIMEMTESSLLLKGTTDIGDLNLPFKIWIQDECGKKYHVSIEKFPPKNVFAYNRDILSEGTKIEIKIPLCSGKKYSFYVQVGNNEPRKIRTGFGWEGKLNHLINNSFWCKNGYTIKLINGNICIYDYNKRMHFASELRYLREILRFGKKQKTIDRKNVKEFMFYRLSYYFYSVFASKKEKWLIIDRIFNATDNGAALFKYAGKTNDKDKKIVFALDKSSDDYNSLKKYGKVIAPESLKYKMWFLKADKVISAYADNLVNNPFSGFSFLIKDLKKSRFIYLQHGIMQGELSNWLNVLNKNIQLLVTSTMMETEQIVNGDFGYSNDQVKLLGSPRFDELFEYENKKKVVIMPTWRNELAGAIIPGTRERKYVYNFKESEYCLFYNSLMNDERLAKVLKKYGYDCEFYIHPNFIKQSEDFIGNDIVKVINKNASYEKVLGEAAILITDYSGIQFDFAYQKKPLIYSHFDDLFAEGIRHHTYQKSYFNYRTQGFGPIAYSVNEVVDELEKIVKNSGIMDKKYKQRVEEFFYYHDKENSKRVYDELCKLSKA